MRQFWNHTWRLLACVLFTMMSVGCVASGQERPDLPTPGAVIQYEGNTILYLTLETPVNCLSFGNALSWKLTLASNDDITVMKNSTRIRSFSTQVGYDKIIPFPALEAALPLSFTHPEDEFTFKGTWDMHDYPVPNPADPYQGVYVEFEITYQDSDDRIQQIATKIYVGIDFYSYRMGHDSVPRTVPCSELKQ